MSSSYRITGAEEQELESREHILHPGYLVEMEIEARGLQKQEVAAQLGIQPGHLSELLKEKRHVSPLMALKLEKVFEIDAEYWLRVQLKYDLTKAREKLAEGA